MLDIAIIDDEPWIVRGLEKSMDWASSGAQVVYMGTRPEEAISHLLVLRPDVVLTDINMGAVSGFELMSRLREGGLMCEFVVISGYDEFDYARQAMTFGVMHYLLKPIDRNELERVMLDVFARVNTRKAETAQQHINEQTIQPEDRFTEMRTYVACHCTQALSLTDLAKSFHYNASYLSDLFKRQLGIGFSEFLNQCRLEQAMLLLTQTDNSVMSISERCGFSDPARFSKLFRRRYDMSPRQWRSKGKTL